MDMNYRGDCGREGVGRMEWSEGGGKWDNCNSIINKYINKYINKILKKKTQKPLTFIFLPLLAILHKPYFTINLKEKVKCDGTCL